MVALSQLEVVAFRTVPSDEWITSSELAAKASIAERTARMYLLKWYSLGLVNMRNVFPGKRYKLSGIECDYKQKLAEAAEVFGV